MPTQKKAYSFTLNNYTDEEYNAICSVLRDETIYGIVGKEVGASGTSHLQGYALFKRPYHFKSVKDRYLPRCHIEVSAGTPDDNRRYCSKDGQFVEFGTIPSKKRGRDELAMSFKLSMESGHSGLGKFADENPGTFYFSGHNLLRNYQSCQPMVARPNINVRWYYGKPGTGKSRKAHEEMPNGYIKDPRTKWWSGYMFEKDVIIDDFGPNGIDINHLLRWFDRYKCLVESKGGMLPLYAENFIVTSNFLPSDIFVDNLGVAHVQLPALMRRIVIEEF